MGGRETCAPSVVLANSNQTDRVELPFKVELPFIIRLPFGRLLTTRLRFSGRLVLEPCGASASSSFTGIVTSDPSGTGLVAILNQDFSVNSGANRADPGSAVTLFATGVGQTGPPGVDGKITDDKLAAPKRSAEHRRRGIKLR